MSGETYYFTEDYLGEALMHGHFDHMPNVGEYVKLFLPEESGPSLAGYVKSIEHSLDPEDVFSNTTKIIIAADDKFTHINFYSSGESDGTYPEFRDQWSIFQGVASPFIKLTFYEQDSEKFLGDTVDTQIPGLGGTIHIQHDLQTSFKGKVVQRIWMIPEEGSWMEVAIILNTTQRKE